MPPRFAAPRFLPAARFAAFAVASVALAPAQPAVVAPEAELPVPSIATAFPDRPGPDGLPDRPALPELLRGPDGEEVSTAAGWAARRKEWLALLEHYAVGHAPPAPRNVTGRELKSAPVLDGAAVYRLVRLEFGPEGGRTTERQNGEGRATEGEPEGTQSGSLPADDSAKTGQGLGFDIAIFTPAGITGPAPVVVFPSFDLTPGGVPLPLLPHPPGQGKGVDALAPVEPLPAAIPVPPAGDRPVPSPEEVAQKHRELLLRGYALVTYHYQDTGEDTTLRLPAGSWAFRTTRFFPAYPGHDWGLLAAWAWGLSRVADYLETQPFADPARLIVTGHSRLGKAVLVAGAFDPRFAVVAPAGTGGGGSGAYRFSGAGRGGREGLDEMMKKYPNWFSPHLHAFRGHVERLPFDQHALIGLVAPRAFLALEATEDPVSLPAAVAAALEGARPVYALFGADDQLGANFAAHGHRYAPEDWAALLDFADWRLRGRDPGRRFPLHPSDSTPPSSP